MIQVLIFMGCTLAMVTLGMGLGWLLDWWEDGAPHSPTDIEYY
jgi:hypothetical protein